MMFFIKPSVVNVDLFTSHDAVFELAKPKKPAAFIPEWWKKLPKSKYDGANLFPTNTMKTCAGFLNLYSSGFICPLWSDLNIVVSPDGAYEYQFADHRSEINHHDAIQFEGSPFFKDYVQVKLLNPWVAVSKSPVKWVLMPTTWSGIGVEHIHVAQGIMQFNIVPGSLNINMFLKKQADPVAYRFEFGTPLMHAVPMTEKSIKLHYHLVEEEKLRKIKYESRVSLFFSNRLNKAKSLCPHAKVLS